MGNDVLRKFAVPPEGWEASTAGGVWCAGCRVRAPPANADWREQPLVACKGTDYHAKCYWIKAPDKMTTVYSIGVGMDEGQRGAGASASTVINKGTKVVLYLRLIKEPGIYYCCQCFSQKHAMAMRSIMMEVGLQAKFMSANENAIMDINLHKD